MVDELPAVTLAEGAVLSITGVYPGVFAQEFWGVILKSSCVLLIWRLPAPVIPTLQK